MTSFAVLALVKATVVCGVAFFLSHLCRRTRASIRHLLFALTFTALVAIPVASVMLPGVHITVPATANAPAPGTPDIVATMLTSAGAASSGSSTPSVSRDPGAADPVTIPQIVSAVWLIGVALFLIPVVVGFWQMRRLRNSALRWTDGQALVQTPASTLGVRRSIEVLLHDAATGPLTCGVLRPSIVLPGSALQWNAASLRCALRHEIEHIARWDFLTHCLSRIICAAYWFHPLVWAAWRQLRLEAERACDDAALREDDASDYASLLVSIAQREPANKRQPVLAMAGRDDLAARVAAVLDVSQSRGRVGRRWAIALAIGAALLTIGVAPVTVARAMPQTQATGAAAPSLASAAPSIKRNPSGIKQTDGRIVANMSLRRLLSYAFGVRDLDNAPWWVEESYNVVANVPSDFTPKQGSKALQSLLTERFKLVAHRGSKEFPIYALILARPERGLGPQITRSQLDCSPGAFRTCGMSSTHGRLTGSGLTMAQLAKHLPQHVRAGMVDRQVIDRTGLDGRFDFTLEWTPDFAARSPAVQPGPNKFFRVFISSLDSNAPILLAALEEQLGLKLESQLAPEPVLVIDSIELPSEN